MALYRRHPWILQLPLTRPPLDPGQLDWLERGLHIQRSTPLTMAEQVGIVLTLLEYARGHAAIANSLEELTRPSGCRCRTVGCWRSWSTRLDFRCSQRQ
jgi:hypothetical protein